MATPLALLEDVKLYLGLSGSGQDVLLTRMITAASAFIESWLSRTIAVVPYSSTVNGNNQSVMFLPNRPIVSVESVVISGFVIPAFTGQNDAGYGYDRSSILLRGYAFERGVQNVTVNYTAGLAANAPEDVPADLTQACIELIALKYRRMGNEGLSSKGMAGETTAFVVSDIPKPVATILLQYRNVVPGA